MTDFRNRCRTALEDEDTILPQCLPDELLCLLCACVAALLFGT